MNPENTKDPIVKTMMIDNEPTLPGTPATPGTGGTEASIDTDNTIPGRTLTPAEQAPISRARARLVRRALDPDHERALEQMRAALAQKDHEGALAFAEVVLAKHPKDLAAKEGQLRSQLALEDAYLKQIGSLERVPQLAIPLNEVRDLSLDHRTGFLLTRIDGVSSLQTVLHISGMSNVDALRAISGLVQAGIVVMDP